jgi:exodeoxyribonuclease VII large subunit
LGYEETLSRGYAVVWGDGSPVMTAKAAGKAAALEIQFRDGRFKPGQSPDPKPRSPKPKPSDPSDQGSLF